MKSAELSKRSERFLERRRDQTLPLNPSLIHCSLTEDNVNLRPKVTPHPAWPKSLPLYAPMRRSESSHYLLRVACLSNNRK